MTSALGLLAYFDGKLNVFGASLNIGEQQFDGDSTEKFVVVDSFPPPLFTMSGWRQQDPAGDLTTLATPAGPLTIESLATQPTDLPRSKTSLLRWTRPTWTSFAPLTL